MIVQDLGIINYWLSYSPTVLYFTNSLQSELCIGFLLFWSLIVVMNGNVGTGTGDSIEMDEEEEDRALLSTLGVTSANPEDIERDVIQEVISNVCVFVYLCSTRS